MVERGRGGSNKGWKRGEREKQVIAQAVLSVIFKNKNN
jgi:hypothetical protein